MFDVILNSFIMFSILPFFPFIVVFIVYRKWKDNNRNALLIAMDVTTVFLIMSVSALFNIIFNKSFGFYLILLFLLIAVGMIGGAQNRLKGKVDVTRMLRAVWRMAFVIMTGSYILLTIIGIIRYIFKSM